MKYKKIKGTNDLFGEDVWYWRFVENTFREVCESFGMEEIRTPIFEQTELFIRSVGEESDIVQKEMYTFQDKAGRSITLRPEGTAPVVRAFLENSLVNRGFQQRYYYIGQMFRYEKPQSGRLRQFHQVGFEIIGSESPKADFEMILAVDIFLKRLGLRKYSIHLNSIGCPECRKQYREVLKEYYKQYLDELCEDCKRRYERNVLRLLDCKEDQKFALNAPKSVDYLCDNCKKHYEKLKEYLNTFEIEYVEDHTLVRGLDYYTRTVFEVRHEGLGAQNSIAGGGRYDGLFSELGGSSIPALGFAAGIERLVLALKSEGIEVPVENVHYLYVATIGERAFKEGVSLAIDLRKKGFRVDMDIMERKLSGQLKHANRMGARYVIIIGDEELEKGIVILRDLETGDQVEVDRQFAVEYISERVLE
ncbi:histidine--tRNA ligase [Thermotoga sp. KOL6]|uniref:histidine--tRNA ligase n=1 Tax=Thermotoga sp. KOL6 TaxID=126741 RepID=UPI000C75BEB7|nr:histidine--tRNA ligase [Thermotoga sp. KOL6]PLV59828.1 histidyl-tRNA synthetase [Thermotoga sp. KOL6]